MKKILITFAFIILLISLVSAIEINYVSPTPANYSNNSILTYQINSSFISDNYNNIKFNFNNSEISLYDDSLVLMMNFDNQSYFGESYNSSDSFVIDLSKYGNNGTTKNNINYTEGKYGGAFNFNGVAKYINVPYKDSLNLSTSSTVSAWIKPSLIDSEGIIILQEQFGVFNAYNLFIDGVNLKFSSNVNSVFYDISNAIEDLNWHHVGVTIKREASSTNMSLYLDGEIVKSGGLISINVTTSDYNFTIGTTSSPFEGYIDSVRIYNRSLSVDEVKLLYETNLNFYNRTDGNIIFNTSVQNIETQYNYSTTVCNSSICIIENGNFFVKFAKYLVNILIPEGNYFNVIQNDFDTVVSNITCLDSNCEDSLIYLWRYWYSKFSYLPNGTSTKAWYSRTGVPDVEMNSSDKQIISNDDMLLLNYSYLGVSSLYNFFETQINENIEDIDQINITSRGYGQIVAGGCVFVNSYDGVRYTPEFALGDLSPHKLWEMPSYGVLPSIKKVDNKYHFTLNELVEETQYIDNIELWKIEHDKDTKVLPEQLSGEIHVISDEERPISSIDSLGNTYTEQIENEDNKFFVSNMTNFNFNNPPDWDYLDLKFNNSDSQNRNIKLILRAKDTGLIHDVWTNVVYGAEGGGSTSYDTLNTDMDFFQNLTNWVQNDAMIHVYQKINGKFEKINSLNFGAITFYHTYAFDFKETKGEDIEIRLVFIPYSFQIDQVYIDRTENNNYTLKRIEPTFNDSNLYVNMSKLYTQDDDYFNMKYGDYVKLDFYDGTNTPKDKEETIIVYSNAYSESYSTRNPSVIKEKNMSILRKLAINNSLSRYMFIEQFYNRNKHLSTAMVSLNTIPYSTDYYINGDMNIQTYEGIKKLKDSNVGDIIESYLTNIMHKTMTSIDILRKKEQTNFEYFIVTEDNNSINTTGSQKFFNGDFWVSAEHLRDGDYLFNITGKTKIINISKSKQTKEYYSATMYNPTYFLNNYLVHNVAVYSLYVYDFTETDLNKYKLLDFHETNSKDTVEGIIDKQNVSRFVNGSNYVNYYILGRNNNDASDTNYLYNYYTVLKVDNNRTLIPNSSGSPFWVNESNPQTINLKQGESKLVNWNIYGQGNINDSLNMSIEVIEALNSDIGNSSRVFNVTIVEGESGSTCIYGGSGNWFVDCSENCTVDSNYEIDGNLSFEGSGGIVIDGNLTFISSGQKFTISQSCTVALSDLGGIN